MADTADETPPGAAEVRRRVERQVHAAVRRERIRQSTSSEALMLGGRGVGGTTSTRAAGIVLSWSKDAREALPKRPGAKKASDTDD